MAVRRPDNTHITFFANNGTDEIVKNYPEEGQKLAINEAVDIPVPGEDVYPGYKFLGWARINEVDGELGYHPDDPDDPRYPLTADDLWLKYENGTFTLIEANQPEITVSQVAADEKQPYHDLFAVWEKIPTFTVVYMLPNGTVLEEYGGTYKLEDYENDTYDLLEAIDGVYYYGGYYFEAPTESGWNYAQGGEDSGMFLEPQADMTYYVKAVPKDYLQPYYKYTYIYAKKKCTNMWVTSCLDDANYYETGFVVIPRTLTKLTGTTVYRTPDPVRLGRTVTITSKDNENTFTITPAEVTRDAYDVGVLTLLAVEPFVDFKPDQPTDRTKQVFDVIPYYVTKDQEIVVGDTGYRITTHNGSKPASKTNLIAGTDYDKDNLVQIIWDDN